MNNITILDSFKKDLSSYSNNESTNVTDDNVLQQDPEGSTSVYSEKLGSTNINNIHIFQQKPECSTSVSTNEQPEFQYFNKMPKEVCSKLNTKPKEKLFCPRSCVRYDETICGTCWLCKMCQKCLFTQEAVENHVKDCHPDIPYFLPKTTKENKDYNTYKIRFKCDYCQKMFFRKTTLKYHIKEHIKSEREDSNEVEDHLLTTKI